MYNEEKKISSESKGKLFIMAKIMPLKKNLILKSFTVNKLSILHLNNDKVESY